MPTKRAANALDHTPAPGGVETPSSSSTGGARPKRKVGDAGPRMGPTPPIGATYLLRRSDVAYRLRMSWTAVWRLAQRDERFPKPVTPPGCLPRWLEEDVRDYVLKLKAERDASAA